MPELILQTMNLSKHYKTRTGVLKALDGVSLQLPAGETLAVVGESGSGKTTLANLILGIEQPTSGEIEFRGEALGMKRDLGVRRQIQYVQQNPMTTLNPRRTVLQSIRVPLSTHKSGTAAEQRKRAAELLELVGMSSALLDRYPSALSGGQRQRVAVARALAVEPRLLVLDEPTSALDVSVQAKTLALLEELREQLRLTYVFISHDLSVVKHMATRVAVMYRGKIVEIAPTEELFASPSHPYTRMLISAVPVVSEEEVAAKPAWPWERNMVLDSSAGPSACSFAPRCPFAQEPCFDLEPPLAGVVPGHEAACHMVTGVLPNAFER